MKQMTTDHGVLQMALVGYELERDRIGAAISEIQAQLGRSGPGRSTSTATRTAERDAPRRKRFSVASRKRMAIAQKKRWRMLKAKRAEATKAKPVTQKKATRSASRKVRPLPKKAVHARKAAQRVKKVVAKSKAPKPVPQVQAVLESAPATA